MTKLSIIITLYKSEAYIQKCLDSIFAQDIPLNEYELVIVDDGSPDHSGDIVATYSKKYRNIKLIIQDNKGLAEARNVGIRHANGKYIRFVDPDDYVEPRGVGLLLRKMEEENLDMLRFNYTMVGEDYKELPDPKSKKFIDYRDVVVDGKAFLGNRLGFACFVWAFIYKKQIITDNSLYFISGTYFDDIYWLPKVLQSAEKVTSVSDRLIYYLQRPGSLVMVDNKLSRINKIEGVFDALDMFLSEINNSVNKNIIRWYRAMIAHAVISMLGTVSITFYSSRQDYINKLKQRNIFPLYIYNSKTINHLHVFLINLSPVFYCWLMNIKRRRQWFSNVLHD